MNDASPLTIFEDSDDDPSAVSVFTNNCASCVPTPSPDNGAFNQLPRLVSGADVRAGDIGVPEWGHKSVEDILLVRSVDLPRVQVVRPIMTRPQIVSDALLHADCDSEFESVASFDTGKDVLTSEPKLPCSLSLLYASEVATLRSVSWQWRFSAILLSEFL
jgi:hypothetical protein